MELTTLSNNALLSTLDSAWTAGNRALAKTLAYLGEVERRRLYVEMACSSMWAFVERRFGLTGGSAHRRLTAAHLVCRFPAILARVEQGDIHLESLCALKDVLTEENVDALMAATAKKTLREVQHIVACLAPKPRRQRHDSQTAAEGAADGERAEHSGAARARGGSLRGGAADRACTAAGRAALRGSSQGTAHGEQRDAREARAGA